jgi:putative ABC transport system permease protein
MMLTLLKIAYRNVIKNKKRAFLIGLAIFFSCIILLVSSSLANGSEKQILKSYINYQAGHVSVTWQNVKDIDPGNPTRLFSSNWDVDREKESRVALNALQDFLQHNSQQVKAFYSSLVTYTKFENQTAMFNGILYSLTQENKDFLLNSGTLELLQGKPAFESVYGLWVKENMALENDIEIGDWITIYVTTPYGAKNAMDFVVEAICANGAPWDMWYGFITDEAARELFDAEADYFNLGRIHLHDPSRAPVFARELDSYLLAKNDTLGADYYIDASSLYANLASYQRSTYYIFFVFLLLVIALGIRAGVRMNLYERMREFATLRAIGFSKARVFIIVFAEIFIISLLALAVALLLSWVVVWIIAAFGIYVGTGPISYMFGGEYFYPEMQINDIIFALISITILSLFAPLKPALKICYQKIADILVNRYRRIWLIFGLLKRLFTGNKKQIVRSENI